LERNAGLKRITDLFHAQAVGGKFSQSSVLHIDEQTEHDLGSLKAYEVGERIVGSILLNGVRPSFLTFFGLQIRWGAKKLEITP
jgi:hypothetical protein